MKYCIKCLAENEDNAQRCKSCGYLFNQNLNILDETWEKPQKTKEKKPKERRSS